MSPRGSYICILGPHWWSCEKIRSCDLVDGGLMLELGLEVHFQYALYFLIRVQHVSSEIFLSLQALYTIVDSYPLEHKPN